MTGKGIEVILKFFFNSKVFHYKYFKEMIASLYRLFLVLFLMQGRELSLLIQEIQFSCSVMFSSMTPWTAACQASLFTTNSPSLLKLMSIESVMPSNHLILCHPLLLLPSIFPSIRVFSNESALRIRWQSIGVSALTSVLPANTQD